MLAMDANGKWLIYEQYSDFEAIFVEWMNTILCFQLVVFHSIVDSSTKLLSLIKHSNAYYNQIKVIVKLIVEKYY
jgi:hypothetical protein